MLAIWLCNFETLNLAFFQFFENFFLRLRTPRTSPLSQLIVGEWVASLMKLVLEKLNLGFRRVEAVFL